MRHTSTFIVTRIHTYIYGNVCVCVCVLYFCVGTFQPGVIASALKFFKKRKVCTAYICISINILMKYIIMYITVGVCEVPRGWFSKMSARMGVIKLVMAGTQDWWRQFPLLLGCKFLMLSLC